MAGLIIEYAIVVGVFGIFVANVLAVSACMLSARISRDEESGAPEGLIHHSIPANGDPPTHR